MWVKLSITLSAITAIVPEFLGTDAIAYLNSYHATVYEALSPYLEGDDLEFLKTACAAI